MSRNLIDREREFVIHLLNDLDAERRRAAQRRQAYVRIITTYSPYVRYLPHVPPDFIPVLQSYVQVLIDYDIMLNITRRAVEGYQDRLAPRGPP